MCCNPFPVLHNRPTHMHTFIPAMLASACLRLITTASRAAFTTHMYTHPPAHTQHVHTQHTTHATRTHLRDVACVHHGQHCVQVARLLNVLVHEEGLLAS